MAAKQSVLAVLRGELQLRCCREGFDLDAIRRSCQPLLELSPAEPAWATTPWGRTLPRSCVGSTPAAYVKSLESRPLEACTAVDELFATPLAHWLQTLFGLPLQPLRLACGKTLPSWALRQMDTGHGIAPHCEQNWNPLNLVERGDLMPVAFDPAFQLSYLYVLQAPARGGELEVFDRRGPSGPGETVELRSCAVVTPHPGELLLFNAGLHWHRVRPCCAPGERVVLGGFVRLNHDHTALHAYV